MSRLKRKTPVQSTQQNIPIKEFVNGLIVTKDNQYIKLLEVLPSPFFLKSIKDQNKISEQFHSLLKAAPDELHIKSITVQADLSYQIKEIEQHICSEKDENCKKMGKEYEKRLLEAQNYGTTHRFFISFPYRANKSSQSLKEISYQLDVDANRLTNLLRLCGNDVCTYSGEEQNNFYAKLFYLLYNRNSYIEEPFEDHTSEIYKRYIEETGNINTFVPPTDYIAPKQIGFQNSKYLVIDDRYYSFLYIPSYGYNPKVITGWLDNFINSCPGVDVDIFLKKLPKSYVINKIKRSIGHSQVSLSETYDTTEQYENSKATLQAGYYLKNGLSSGEDFYYIATMITVSDKKPEQVELKIEELKNIARRFDIVLRENKYEAEQSFIKSLPTSMLEGDFFTKMKRNTLTDGAASLYPFTSFQILDKEGLYIADNLSNGSPVILDQYNRAKLTNPHMVVFGSSGSGKSVSVLEYCLRSRVKNMPVFFLAPEKEDELLRVCDAIGGQFVSIGAGSSQRLNVMEIFMEDEEGREFKDLIGNSKNNRTFSLLSNKISSVMEFLELHIKDMSIEEKQLLNEAIIRTYAKKGITISNDSLWNKAHTKYKEMPILSDLVRELESKSETLRLARATKLLTTGSGAYFNGKTNVDVNKDFFVIGLEHNTDEMLGLAIYVAMEYCWSKIKENRARKKVLVCDEWWRFAFNPIAANKSLEISKLARSYNATCIFATQNPSDIMAVENGKYGNAVLGNCATKLLLKMEDKDIYSLAEMIELTDSEIRSISRFKAGQGLMVAGESRIRIQFTPSETEKLLTFTDEATLIKYAQLKKQENENILKTEKLNSVEDIEEKLETYEQAKNNLKPIDMISLETLKQSLDYDENQFFSAKDFVNKNWEGRINDL